MPLCPPKPPENGSLCVGRMQNSECHAGAAAAGVSDTLEFYYPRCHKNKCPLPGGIRAVLRFQQVNNLQEYFMFMSYGRLRVGRGGSYSMFWGLLACRFIMRSGGKLCSLIVQPPAA